MIYLMKEEVAEMIKHKYKCTYLAKEIGISLTYLSLILHRKQKIEKRLAYFITKTIDSEKEIEDFFERV